MTSNLPALGELARTSVSRVALSRSWISVAASNVLQVYGYKVRIWIHIARGTAITQLFEYLDPMEHVRGRSRFGRGHRNFVDVTADVRPGSRIGQGVPYKPLGPPRLPRVTAHTYRRQVAVHLALGLPIVPRGQPWVDLGRGQAGLFDQVLAEECA